MSQQYLFAGFISCFVFMAIIKLVATLATSLRSPQPKPSQSSTLGKHQPILRRQATHAPPQPSNDEVLNLTIQPSLTNEQLAHIFYFESLQSTAPTVPIVTFEAHQPTVDHVAKLELALEALSEKVEALAQCNKVRADCEQLKDAFERMLNGEFPHTN